MARITVEDCIKRIPNRFELILTASQRSRDISRGEKLRVERDNDKNTVVSLREIAEELVTQPELEEAVIKRMQKVRAFEDRDEEEFAEAIERSFKKPEADEDATQTAPFLPPSKKDNFSSNMDAQADMHKFEDVDPDELEE